MSNSHRDLIVWQRAKQLAIEVYRHTNSFPRTEVFGLTSQLRRAAVSVPSNIAEGQGRLTTGEFCQFLGHARGSLLEIRTQLEIASDLAYLQAEQHTALQHRATEVLFLLNRLVRSLQNQSKSEKDTSQTGSAASNASGTRETSVSGHLKPRKHPRPAFPASGTSETRETSETCFTGLPKPPKHSKPAPPASETSKTSETSETS